MMSRSQAEGTPRSTGQQTLDASKVLVVGAVGDGVWAVVGPGGPNSIEVVLGVSCIASSVALHLLGKMSIKHGGMHPPIE